MLIVFTLCTFLAVSGGTAWMLLPAGAWRRRAIARLSPTAPNRQSVSLPAALIWSDLVRQIGAALPVSSRSVSLLRKQLVWAGYRSPQADRYFQGARLLSTFLFVAGALIATSYGGNWLSTAMIACVIGYLAPGQVLSLLVRRRQHAIARGLPNTLDLMVVCVEAGLGIDQTALQVAKELQSAHPEICEEFALMNLELRAGKSRADTLHNLAERTGVEDVRKLVAVLVQTDRFGTSIAKCLRGHAEYLREMARQRAEARASKLAVKLVFPIFFCVLPSLFVVTVGPVIVHMVRDLIPMLENL